MKKKYFFGQSDVGLKRAYNEDAFITREDLLLCIVADGMGGASAGELASRIFVESVTRTFATKIENHIEEVIHLMKKSFYLANKEILNHVEVNPQHKGMGCTAEVLAFADDEFIVGHMGDSRTYRFRTEHLRRLTHDHSLVQEQIDNGLISEEEGMNHSMRNIVLRAVGVEEEIALDILRGSIKSGDQFLLCSDGLTDMVPEDDIEHVLSLEEELPEKVEKLIHMARANGGSDNITAVIASVSG